MNHFINKLILILCCAGFAITLNGTYYIAFPVLLVVILSALCSIYPKPIIHLAVFVLYLICCCIYPLLLYFLPMMCYEIVWERFYYSIGLLCIPLLIQYQNIYGINLLMILVLCGLSSILKHNSYKLKMFQDNYIKLRDETAGMADILEKKNRDLMEKQDYEVNLATLNERNRIAREIHDNVGHMLSRSILQVGALIAITKDDTVKEALGDVKNSLTDGMDSIRNSIHNIHDESIDLKTKLDALVHEFTFCSVYLDYNVTNDFTTKAKYSILYIVKEALNNVMKHSNATRVTISVMEHQSVYQIVIADNGTNTGKKSQSKSEPGMGVSSMQERIESLNGTMYVDTDKGYQIFISLPKKEGA
ncbi:MAG: sensor histidine kinase [bacterium]|nr:sensor histidine kinase [bacterium]